MAALFNNLPVIGVVQISDARLLYNNRQVRGIREEAGTFTDDKVIRGIDVLAEGATIHNDQPVIGVVVITDPATEMFNDQSILPVTVQTGSLI